MPGFGALSELAISAMGDEPVEPVVWLDLGGTVPTMVEAFAGTVPTLVEALAGAVPLELESLTGVIPPIPTPPAP